MRFLIIGDVHGGYAPFKRAVDFACENDLHLISVGDLIDNGPDGAKVVSEMLKLLDQGKASVVKGNHEHKIIRYINGANVILGPPNMVTIDQFKTDKAFEVDFRRMVEDYCENFIKISENIFVTHAGMHPDFWEAEASNKTYTRKMTDEMMFGQADYSKTFEHGGQTYPARTYQWRHSVPSGITLIVGHDPAPLGFNLSFKELIDKFNKCFFEKRLIITSFQERGNSFNVLVSNKKVTKLPYNSYSASYSGTGDLFVGLFIKYHFFNLMSAEASITKASKSVGFLIQKNIELNTEPNNLLINPLTYL